MAVKLVALPALPSSRRASRPPQDCGCGCGLLTRGGRFVPGHDARLLGWVIRAERGIMSVAAISDLAGEATAAAVAVELERRAAAAE